MTRAAPADAPRPPATGPWFWVAALAFVLSGAAGLVYESLWSRYLGLFVGHTAYAQTLVLALFMGGMAAGAFLVGRRSGAIRDPLLAYALVEIAIAVLGMAFHPVYQAVTAQAYAHWFPALGESTNLKLVQWGLGALLILPQSVMLGATFPLMSAGVLRRFPAMPGRSLAHLYFANSLGGAAGALAGGFLLVPAAGLPGTGMAAAGLNLVAALVALAVRHGLRGPASATAAAPAPRAAGVAPRLGGLLLAVAFGTAVASFAYEIAWIRMLSLVLGSATHSFELMLSAFILGIALGALWIRARADRLRDPLRALGWAQWTMGALAVATLPLYAASFHWMAGLVQTLPPTPAGYTQFALARYGICLVVMLPATFCAGITLPLLTRLLLDAGAGERAVGVVYGWNTLGAIVGVALSGLVLLPVLGLEGLLVAGAALDIALGVMLFARAPGPRRWIRPVAAAAAGAGFLFLVARLTPLDPLTLVSGVFRNGVILQASDTEVLFYRDGRTATVSVRRQPDGERTLSTNGKPDASVSAAFLDPDPARPPAPLTEDSSTQLLLGLVSLAHLPDATRAAVVGIGSGITSHILLGSPTLTSLTTIEIEPEMVTGARLFHPANRRVFEDPRSQIVIEDARAFFAASGGRFDLIVSEPSNPWVSGVAGLFTAEFYTRMRAALTDDGVLGQWLHLYSLNDDLAMSVLAAVHRNFSDYVVYLVSGTDALIVATNREGGVRPDWSVSDLPAITADLRPTYRFGPGVFDALRIADRAALAPLLEGAAPNSDFFPILDLGAERARYLGQVASGWLALHADRLGPAAAGAARVPPSWTTALPLPSVPRVHDLILSSRLRALLAGAPTRPGEDSTMVAAVLRQAALHTAIPGATGDWGNWMREVVRAELDLHRGTSGFADEPFFVPLALAASAAGAPLPVRAAIAWLHAAAARDDDVLSRTTDLLVAEAEAGRYWLPPDYLLDGGVAVRLRRGDRSGALALARIVGPHTHRPAQDLRTRLLEAHLTGP